ncbi:MAG: hypothetical protein QOF21_2895 [Actinomycetota bacterium]|jgi:hypothetical protein
MWYSFDVPLPPDDIHRIETWVVVENERIGEHRDQVRVELLVSRNAVTIVESRPSREPDSGEWTQEPVARLRFERTRGWTLYWSDRNGDFHEYDLVESTQLVQRLLDEVNEDPTCIFWG